MDVTRISTPIRRAWESITEPRHLKVFYFGVYALTLAIGLVTLAQPPQSIEGPLGPILAALWAGMLTAGGLGGALAVLPGWWWAERLSVLLAMGGTYIYAGIAVYLHVTGPPGSQRLTQALTIILATTVFWLRLLLTRRWDYEPRRR
ncbi:hypothetical protein [Microbacterium sp. gxy059]|uniref:hypothetical protein n=1 Tax=Microbacterium sp. gxy059 TaxID=2957199 RepID=UPI003D991D76